MAKEEVADRSLLRRGFAVLPGVHRFAHRAMAATFEVLIADRDQRYAEQAAWAAFKELDRLDRELSRYVENSEISRLNALPAETPLVVSPEAFECLALSARMFAETDRAFDVTVGPLLACWRASDTPARQTLAAARAQVGTDLIELDARNLSVRKRSGGVHLDLGGIGKGYALDRMAVVLRDWSLSAVLLHGGQSSVLAIDPPPGRRGWPLAIRVPQYATSRLASIELTGAALGASGLAKGQHIIDPRTGHPAAARPAAWARATTAARADALSTAFMVLTVPEIQSYCRHHADAGALLVTAGPAQRVIRCGRFGRT